MKTFYIKQEVSKPKNEGLIYVARNGQGYFANDELHLMGGTYHYVYLFSGENMGWYMRNQSTYQDYYLGVGASPTITLDECDIKDETYCESITYIPEEHEIEERTEE